MGMWLNWIDNWQNYYFFKCYILYTSEVNDSPCCPLTSLYMSLFMKTQIEYHCCFHQWTPMAYIFNGFWFVTSAAVHKPHLVYGPVYSLLNLTIQLLHVDLFCQLLFPACQRYAPLLKLFIKMFFKKIPSGWSYPLSALHVVPVYLACMPTVLSCYSFII